MDWLDLLAVQGSLRSLLQHHSSKASILRYPAFLMVQLSHLYMTTGKTIALTLQTSVSKVMSVLFNTLSSFLIAFLPRSKRFLISWLQSLSTVILEPKKIKPVTVSTFSPSICLHLCPCKPSGCPGALGTWVLATWLSSAALAPPRLLSDPRGSQAQEKEICSVHWAVWTSSVWGGTQWAGWCRWCPVPEEGDRGDSSSEVRQQLGDSRNCLDRD